LTEADSLVLAEGIEVEREDRERFGERYRSDLRPYLGSPSAASAAAVESVRNAIPVSLRPALAEIEAICEEDRQLNLQRRYYHWLHVWLIVHVPLSIALLVLGGVHAVMALRY